MGVQQPACKTYGTDVRILAIAIGRFYFPSAISCHAQGSPHPHRAHSFPFPLPCGFFIQGIQHPLCIAPLQNKQRRHGGCGSAGPYRFTKGTFTELYIRLPPDLMISGTSRSAWMSTPCQASATRWFLCNMRLGWRLLEGYNMLTFLTAGIFAKCESRLQGMGRSVIITRVGLS